MIRTHQKTKEDVQTISRRSIDKEVKHTPLLSSGSTLLNCALADNAYGGIGQGKIINIIGDSSAGKTMIAETMLAEIANNPDYDEYDLYLDDSEHALEMDVQKLFGTKGAARIKAPKYDSDGNPIYSDTIEQWYARMLFLIEQGLPFVYILDSLDTLTDSNEYDQAAELHKTASKTNSEDKDKLTMPGSYGMTKAKLMSQILRTLKGQLARTKSVLVIISQTRDNINARPGQSTKKRAGGRALEFYCSHVVWLTVTKTHKAGKKEVQEIIGRQVEAKVSKNKITGKIRSVTFDIFYDYGVDDIGSCIDFLIKYAVIKQKGAYLTAPQELIANTTNNMYRKDLIDIIENDPILIDKLRSLVHETWLDKEEKLALNRKPRFQ